MYNFIHLYLNCLARKSYSKIVREFQFRKAEADEKERETFEAFFKMIESKLLKNGSRSEGYGLKIFPNCNRSHKT